MSGFDGRELDKVWLREEGRQRNRGREREIGGETHRDEMDRLNDYSNVRF